VTETSIEAIRSELFRIRADAGSVGQTDAIFVKDWPEAYASLEGSPRATDFHWFGPALEILTRLSELPDEAGPEAVRSEFHTGAG
jgi:hypothetical protein